MPALAAQVTEYQGHYRTCPCCGRLNHAAIPHDLKAHSVGPRLAATLGYLAGTHHLSQRGLEEVVEDVFEVPIALGTVAHLEAQLRDALAPAHAEAVAAVRAADVKNVDETSGKLAGKLCWLWVAATQTVAAFLVHAKRGVQALQALLGVDIHGLVGSDRWSAYAALEPWWRQICWAHLKRDFQKLVDRGGPAARLGQRLQQLAGRVFEEWHLFRGGTIPRRELALRIDPEIGRLRRLLRSGCRCADGPAATFCANLLDIEVGRWQFVAEEGVEPTNHHAERLLRRGVLWRKNAFGSHSEAGCRLGGAAVDGGADAALARPIGVGVFARRVGGSSQRPPRTFAALSRMNGYAEPSPSQARAIFSAVSPAPQAVPLVAATTAAWLNWAACQIH